MRINDYRQAERHQQNNTLASGFEVSAKTRQAFFPAALRMGSSRLAGPKPGALNTESKHLVTPSLVRSRVIPLLSTASLVAPTERGESAAQGRRAAWKRDSAQFMNADGRPTIRLYTAQPLAAAQPVLLSEKQRHYLATVMRQREGGIVAVFNGVDGEWSARIDSLSRRRCDLTVLDRLRPQPPPDVGPILVFAVLKSARLPLLVEKATELGVRELQPVLTRRCAVRAPNLPKLSLIAAEAAEQSLRLTVPAVREPVPLEELLATWHEDARLLLCDERGGGVPLAAVARAFDAEAGPETALLVGPEGGFAPEEFEAMDRCGFVYRVSLGPTTLRAETAALAALAVWNCGVGSEDSALEQRGEAIC